MSDLTPTPAEADGSDRPADDPASSPLEAAANGALVAPERLEGRSDQDGFAAEPPPLETVAATAEEFVAGLLQAAELEAEVASSVTDDSALVEVTGEAMGVLIGRRGQTLDAVQELTRTAVQHRLKARVRVLVDIEGYRARRQASLADYATAMAERAKARGTEIELEPMSAYERKIVHTAVAEVPGASSYSEGEEPQRKVIIRGEE
ncbi:MAG TPA: RNA-binding cell elongation regulator Jag/EloR [Actinomycetota bacterium]|nr:RNA-binding cell elongation regulator Jag/EloR [Actinomycetota bacterium]